ncbi:hypothetical protein [Emticicia sp. SJ17W-69]|uniref:hypothetical protein n=1 Tax=Emticicia sp. SJ17W-69 TaxID=3421657 RepID=UPI003EB6DA48
MKRRFILLNILILLVFGFRESHAQDLKNFKLKNLFDRGIKVSGGVTANQTYYNAWGIADRQVPINFLYSGNLTLDILGKIKMPVLFSFSNQNITFTHPFNSNYRFAQPFNRLVLKPTYKSFTLHIGTCALNFSPYTLAAHRYDGIGLEYKPKKGAFYGSFMLGNLKKATRIDTTFTIRNAQPSFKRLGVGIMLGIRKKQDAAELIIFTAKDQLNSLPYSLDAQSIFPQANVASSLKLKKSFGNKIIFQSEIAISGMTTDTRANEGSRRHTFFNSYAGLLKINSSTTYSKALRLGFDYKGKGFTSGLEYNRVDPEYRTLGAYYFCNNLENITTKISTQLQKGKISINGNLGLQRDNLDKKRLQTLSRFVGMANIALQPSEKLTLNFSYSNFLSYSNLRSSFEYLTQITPYDALDTLNFRQINQNITAMMNFTLPSTSQDISKNLAVNLIYQNGNDQQGSLNSDSKLYNISANYGHNIKSQKLNLAGALNLSKNEVQGLNDLMWGPSLTITKGFANELTTMLGLMYSNSLSQKKVTNNILSGRLGLNYAIKKKHQLTLNVIYLDKQSLAIERRQPSFSELTITLGYAYRFAVKLPSHSKKE